MRLPADLTNVALAKLQELIDLPSLPHDDPNAAYLHKVKRKARRILHAHYDPGGPYEAFSPTQDDGKSKKRRRRRDPSR
jgi:hypothetical protein